MAPPLDYTLNLLEGEFEELVALFPTKEWKYFKFGQGGPHKRVLQKLTKMAQEYDKVIIEHFGLNEEIATFRRLVGIGLLNEEPKDLHKICDTFRRQIKRMKGQLE